ncbi:MAG: MBL fold metallo-hydrolase [Bacteroidota bacterium]
MENPQVSLTIWGAAQQVTGSMHMLRWPDGYTVLVDCGFDMDPKEEAALPGIFPFDPSEVDAVLLTHAHMDHSGHLPNLVKMGFRGRVHCTYATLELARLLLHDSANLNERDLKRYAGKDLPKLKGPLRYEELFSRQEAEDALNVFVTHEPDSTFTLKEGIEVEFRTAGHLLGAVHIVVSYQSGDQNRRIAFSGDVGRADYPLLRDPQGLPPVDYLVMETTYGNRGHTETRNPQDVMEEVIRKVCVENPGRLIIPAFSVGRTQALLFTLNQLYRQRRLPPIRVFADSPLALQSTKVYAKYADDMNTEARQFHREHEGLFDFDNLHYVRNFKQSREVNNYLEPCIIIASSGMVAGGRIEHHIRTNLQNPFATVFFIGYTSPGTFGHELLNGRTTMREKRQDVEILASVDSTDVFSGHGDVSDLLRLVKQQPQLRQIFLVHGDASAMHDFQATLEHQGYPQSAIPEKGQTYWLD